ncbi:hypothetical protein [Halovivax sp.]|uniref:DUF7527 domain-containing protein n=1 Tax=Halovivax sp. TaxID=1935978 RepID=UPI0025BE03BE|nr:hypothetical protein [Halovivax sp.]
MDPRTQERVERWESRPFSGGRDELVSLADREFSGAVEAAGTWLFMLNGRVVGVVDGAIEDALDAGGTVYDAPDAALPLLAAMLEQGGETRAKYYTNETPLSEVDHKLRQGSFTGYIELSEQVLSGDYYAVYYGGRRMAAAYIGNAERLLTGEEAFERADDEIGIYEVTDVDVEVTDIPGREVESTSGDASGDAASSEARTASEHASGETASNERAAAPTREAAEAPENDRTDDGATRTGGSPTERSAPADVDPARAAGDEVGEPETDDAESAATVIDDAEDRDHDDPSAADADAGATGDPGTEPSGSRPDRAEASRPGTSSSAAADAGITTSEDEPAQAGETGITTDESSGDRSNAGGADASGGTAAGREGAGSPGEAGDGTASGGDDEPDPRFREEARWRETRQIPSIDPDASGDEDRTGRGGRARRGTASGSRQDGSRSRSGRRRSVESDGRPSTGGESTADRSAESASSAEGAGAGGDGRSSMRSGPKPETVASSEQALRSDMLEREDKIDQLTQRVTDLDARRKALEAERDELASENQELSATVDRLQSRIEELEAELERLRGQATADAATTAAGAGGGTSLSPQQALDQTNVFVRYGSKSQPTLASAHDGDAGRGEVGQNLHLERHTQFEADDAVVVGQPYDEFVEDTMQYRFVEWLVGTVLFEIRDTGHADALGDLYDVIPRIDRVELSAEISLEEDDTENVPDLVTFDVAAFDKRGTPLAVANCNDSRDPATREMLESLEADASAVNANYPELGAAFVVTSSFFDPGALEVAEEATTGGFLSRGSKLSYVNLSRKQGYHLCLVEDRSGGFHLTVPEL